MMFVPGAGWHEWRGSHWAPDETGGVVRLAKLEARQQWARAADAPDADEAVGHCRKSESASGIAATLKLAQSEPSVAITVDRLDADPWLLNVENGMIDLRDGTLRPHERSDRITRRIGIAYDPDIACPRFEQFLAEVQSDESMRGYIQRKAGGASGKSVLVDLLMHVLGPYAGTAPDSLLTAKTFADHPTELADLQGKRLVVASETEEGAKLRIQLVKKPTGDERIKTCRMRQDFYEFNRTCKFWLVTNNKPRVDEGTHAVWRRLRLVPLRRAPFERRPSHRRPRPSHEPGPRTDERSARGVSRAQPEGAKRPTRRGARPPG